jgi:DNA (cytosine-5)-methyltransferase 1
MSKPLLLDAFCKAGGSSMGYYRAGFEVVGVDIEPQKSYPFEFHQSDAIEFVLKYGKKFDVIAASPPCQVYSVTSPLSSGNHPDLVDSTRNAMIKSGKSYIIENVPGAPLINPIMLCGTMFGLKVIRHRLFECSPVVWWPPSQCMHIGRSSSCIKTDVKTKEFDTKRPLPGFKHGYKYITVVGNDYIFNDGKIAMDIDWMTQKELSQAIPPAYTEWLGKEMRKLLKL